MKEIVKEKTTTEYIKYYEAFDGTVFNCQTECDAFEQSALGVVLSKLHEFGISIKSQDWLDGSNDENEYVFVVPTKQAQLDTLNQLMYLCRGTNDTYTDKPFFTKECLNKPYLIGYRWYCNKLDWSWFYSVEEIIQQATNDKYKIIKK